MKKLWILTLTVLSVSLFFTACSFKVGDNTSTKSTTEKKSVEKTEKVGKKSNANKSEITMAKSNEETIAENEETAEYKLEIIRTIQMGEKPEGGPQHGDYIIYRILENGGTVGELHLFKPREAMFYIWDGEVVAGPLTTQAQVDEALAMITRQSSAESASEHETRMEIMRNFPTDRNKRVRVYDADGNLIREDY